MGHKSLLQLVALFRKSVPRVPSFNVFSALRCEHDEVNLHSRFLAALIDPSCHAIGSRLCGALLEQINIPIDGPDRFSLEGLEVLTEYRKIDIFVKNSAGQAIIIENKIYARDQERQLRSYHDTIRELGYTRVYVLYLTLNGRDPSEQSLGGLDKEPGPTHFKCISYAGDIRCWLEQAAAIAVRDVPLRESIFQYRLVLDRLTGHDQERRYMQQLVDTLLIGDNMILARDLRAAYVEALVELQGRFWQDVIKALEDSHPDVSKHLRVESMVAIGTRRATIAKYYEPARRDTKYYGLGISIPGYQSSTVRLEVERELYFGVHCADGKSSTEYRRAAKTLDEKKVIGQKHETWPCWEWVHREHNFQEPNEALLKRLTNEQQRREMAAAAANHVAALWHAMTG